jgi:hypothetical protein
MKKQTALQESNAETIYTSEADVRPGVVKVTAEEVEDSLTRTTEYGIHVLNGCSRVRRRPLVLKF